MTDLKFPDWVSEYLSPKQYAQKLLTTKLIRDTFQKDSSKLIFHHADGMVEDATKISDNILKGFGKDSTQGVTLSQTKVSSSNEKSKLIELEINNRKVLLEINSSSFPGSKRGKVYIDAISTNPKAIKQIEKTLNSIFIEEGIVLKETFSILMPGPFGLYERSVTKPEYPLITENYNPKVAEGFKEIKSVLKTDDLSGRFILLEGPPGTGKTYFLRALMSEIEDTKFIIVPQSKDTDISNPDLITLLLGQSEGRRVVLILEDADTLIRPRSQSTTAAVSSLLNLTDGIIGLALDLVIIATTNAEIHEIDSALLRPGRLLKRLEIGLLDTKQAQKIYKRIAGKDPKPFKTEVSLAEIYVLAKSKNKVETVNSLRDLYAKPHKAKIID